MSCTIAIEAGNPAVLEVAVKNALTGLADNGATVTVRVTNEAGVDVAGETWPATLAYVASSSGLYRRQLSQSLAVVAGTKYKAWFSIVDSNSTPRTMVYDVIVGALGCGPPNVNDPSSSVYKGKTAQQRLNEAYEALHDLNLGGQARSITDRNGERIEYSSTNSKNLLAYIVALQAEMQGSGAAFGPAGVIF